MGPIYEGYAAHAQREGRRTCATLLRLTHSSTGLPQKTPARPAEAKVKTPPLSSAPHVGFSVRFSTGGCNTRRDAVPTDSAFLGHRGSRARAAETKTEGDPMAARPRFDPYPCTPIGPPATGLSKMPTLDLAGRASFRCNVPGPIRCRDESPMRVLRRKIRRRGLDTDGARPGGKRDQGRPSGPPGAMRSLRVGRPVTMTRVWKPCIGSELRRHADEFVDRSAASFVEHVRKVEVALRVRGKRMEHRERARRPRRPQTAHHC